MTLLFQLLLTLAQVDISPVGMDNASNQDGVVMADLTAMTALMSSTAVSSTTLVMRPSCMNICGYLHINV